MRRLRAEVEDRAKPPSDEPLADRSPVADAVADLRAAVDRLELVRVLPESVRPMYLPIDKSVRRLPDGDPGRPGDRDAEEAQPVSEQRALAQLGRRLEDAEVEPRRRDPLEVARVGEEGERLLERDRDDLLAD